MATTRYEDSKPYENYNYSEVESLSFFFFFFNCCRKSSKKDTVPYLGPVVQYTEVRSAGTRVRRPEKKK